MAALANPTVAATVSIDASVVSSSAMLARTRCSMSQRPGVVPVALRKRRVNVRTLMYARPASASRSSGSSRRSSAQVITLAIGSSSPVAAMRNAPLQIETSRAPRSFAARRAATTAADGSPLQPGTMIVSAVSSASSPCSTKKANPPAAAGSGPVRSAATVSSYHQGTSSSGRSSPKISTMMPSSNGAIRGGASA